MKLIATLALVRAAAAAVHERRLAEIAEVEAAEDVHWRAAPHVRFASEAPGASKTLCGVKAGWQEDIRAGVESGEISEYELPEGEDADMPDEFDSATNWPKCAAMIDDIRDQSNCGCCWAFAGAEAASDRMCITTDAKMMLPLSAEDVCFCANPDGCDGGMISTPFSYIKRKGAVTGGQYQDSGPFQGMCSDYSLPHCHHHGPQGDDPFPPEGAPGCPSERSPQCPKKCDSSAAIEHSDFKDDKISFDGQIQTARGEQKIQHMIMTGGPVETAFTVYSDFENYAGGIYHRVTGQMAGGHAVKMVGWGVENGVKYWKVANSWNPHWGEKGYFRIRRGNNECGIEDQVIGTSHEATWAKMQGGSEIVV